jgi:hypothetical protein
LQNLQHATQLAFFGGLERTRDSGRSRSSPRDVLALYPLAGIGITAAIRATRSGGDTSDVRVAHCTRGAMVETQSNELGRPAGPGSSTHLNGLQVSARGRLALCGLLRRAADGVREVHQEEKREERQSKRGERSRPHVILPSGIPFYSSYSTPMSRSASQTTTPV